MPTDQPNPTSAGTNEAATSAGQSAWDFKLRDGGTDLKKRSVRSGAVTLASQAARFGLQTASTMILARLLTPGDFGIIAMVAAVTAFARVFQDMGLSTATIQHPELSHTQVTMMFWLNVLIGSLLTLAVAASAPVLALFYHQPEVFWLAIALSAIFLIDSLGGQHSALLTRRMQFRTLAVIQVAAIGIGSTASILGALLGLGYWALVLGSWVTTVVNTALLWSNSPWRPGLPVRGSGIGALLTFGTNVTGSEVANYFSRNLDNILIGRVWGAQALGLYSRAYALLMFPIRNLRIPLNAVAYPALSRLQGDPKRYRAYYGKYVALLGFASMPIAAFLFVCSDNTVNLLLGSRWSGASAIFRVLAVVAFIQPVLSTQGMVMLSCGFSRRYLWLGVVNAAVMAASFGLGVIWGPIGVASAYAVAFYLTLYPILHYGFKGTPLRVGEFFSSMAKAVVASIAAGSMALALKLGAAWSHDLTVLLGCGTTFVLTYLAVFWLLPGGREELREYLSHLNLIVTSRFRGSEAA